MLVIFALSSLAGEDLPKVRIAGIDKVAHFVEYFILGYLLLRAFLYSNTGLKDWKLIALSVIIAALYAAADEWRQQFIAGRIPDVFDFAADLCGMTIGVFLYNNRR